MTDTEKANIKKYLKDYLIKKDIPTDKCFNCINPNHPDIHPSMSFDEKRNRLHCFACKADYDIFDCIGIFEGLSGKEVFERAEELYGSGNHFVSDIFFTRKKEKNFTGFIKESQNSIDGALPYLNKRGLNLDIARKYGLGFASQQQLLNMGLSFTDSLIFPTGSNTFTMRNIKDESSFRYQKKGNGFFNFNAIKSGTFIFITEGEFDALSLLSLGYDAIALGSVNNIDSFVNKITLSDCNNITFIVSMDNDEAGLKAQASLCTKLSNMNIAYFEFIPKSYKDINEYFVKAKDELQNELKLLFRDEATDSLGYSVTETENIETLNQLEIFSEEDFFEIDLKSGSDMVDFVSKRSSVAAISTGIDKLDEVLSGGIRSEVVVIGGASSVGKTTLMLQIGDYIAQQGRPVIFFSAEMKAVDLIAKSLSRISYEKSKSDFLQPMTANEISFSSDGASLLKLKNYYGKFSKFMFFKDNDCTDVSDIINSVTGFIDKTKITPVVIVDYLQFFTSGKTYSDKQRIDNTIAELKQLNMRFGVPLLITSSFNRASYKEPVSMESFKESGSVEYSADLLCGIQFTAIHNKNFNIEAERSKKTRDVELVVLKNRMGATGDIINLKYQCRYNKFE